MKQLCRRIEDPSLNFTNQNIIALHQKVCEDISIEKFEQIYEVLNQENILSQIYARAVAKIISEESNEKTIIQLEILNKFAELLIKSLSGKSVNYPISVDKYPFPNQQFNQLSEELRPIKKKRNQNLTTIEHILLYLINEETQNLTEILEKSTWSDLLSFVFKTDVENRAQGIEKIEYIHIKEQILGNNITGDIVTDISLKYDGIVTYTMSGLTMLATSEYAQEFTPLFNEILQKLGSSTKMILMQTRLQKNITRYTQIQEKLNQFSEKCGEFNIGHAKLENFQLSKEILDASIPAYPEEFTVLGRDFAQANNSDLSLQLTAIWDEYLNIYDEFLSIFRKLQSFLNSIVSDCNIISATLFSKRFSASLPMYDIERCENAGIHIKNLVETSSSKKMKIDDFIIDIKLKLFRKYEEEFNTINKIITKKVKEEASSNSNTKMDQPFQDMNKELMDFNQKFLKLPVLQGLQEGVIFSTRFLFSILSIFRNLSFLIKPIEKINYCEVNQEEFETLLAILPQYQNKLKNLIYTMEVISKISNYTDRLNREYVLEFAEDSAYILNPSMILTKIEEIPEILKREVQQRLITSEERDMKLEIFEKLLNIVQKFINIPIDHRVWILPFAKDEYVQMLSD